MPSSRAGNKSVRNPGRKPGHGESKGVQLHFIPGADTRYPDLRSKRRFPGNKDHPDNPFGGELTTSPYPYTKVKEDDFSQRERVSTKNKKGKNTRVSFGNPY